MIYSKIKYLIKASIKGTLAKLGYRIVKSNHLVKPRTMIDAIASIYERNHPINTVVDVGAAEGSWSKLFMDYFPDLNYLLIEAQSCHEQSLISFCLEHKNSSYVLAAAGDSLGKIFFDTSDPFGGQASYKPFEKNNAEVTMTTIDHEVQSRKLSGPYLVKLDTHGFEIPILKGASHTLSSTEVLIIECYNFRISEQCLLFYEMCEYLKEIGFRCIDLVDPLYRPTDRAFWQADLVFVRDDRNEFRNLSYF